MSNQYVDKYEKRKNLYCFHTINRNDCFPLSTRVKRTLRDTLRPSEDTRTPFCEAKTETIL